MGEIYEKYPLTIVGTANALSLSIYALGIYIMAQWGWIGVLVYVLLIVWLVGGVLRGSCVHCYYYGKRCGTGWGKISAWFFKPGDPKKFSQREVTWKEMIPDLLALAVPMVAGMVSLFKGFSWIVVAAMVMLMVLSMYGNAMVRGKLLCVHCRQCELGCPAQKLFAQQGNRAK